MRQSVSEDTKKIINLVKAISNTDALLVFFLN